MLFAFLLTLHPQPLQQDFQNCLQTCGHIGSRVFGGWEPLSHGRGLQPCVPGPPPSVDSARPFSLSQDTSPSTYTHGRTQAHGHKHRCPVPWGGWRDRGQGGTGLCSFFLSHPQVQSRLDHLLHAGSGDPAPLEFFHDCHSGATGSPGLRGYVHRARICAPGIGREVATLLCTPHSISQTAWTSPRMCPRSLSNWMGTSRRQPSPQRPLWSGAP